MIRMTLLQIDIRTKENGYSIAIGEGFFGDVVYKVYVAENKEKLLTMLTELVAKNLS